MNDRRESDRRAQTGPSGSADHARHDRFLVSQLAAGDLDELDRPRARALVEGCADCRGLAADLQALTSAARALPRATRPRDFRLSPERAREARGRRTGWAQWLASPRFAILQPAGAAAASIGLVLVLVGSITSQLGSTGGSGSAQRQAGATTAAVSAPRLTPAFLVGGAATASATQDPDGPVAASPAAATAFPASSAPAASVSDLRPTGEAAATDAVGPVGTTGGAASPPRGVAATARATSGVVAPVGGRTATPDGAVPPALPSAATDEQAAASPPGDRAEARPLPSGEAPVPSSGAGQTTPVGSFVAVVGAVLLVLGVALLVLRRLVMRPPRRGASH